MINMELPVSAGFILSLFIHKSRLDLEVLPPPKSIGLRTHRSMGLSGLFPSLHISHLGNQRITSWGGIFEAADHFALGKANSKDR